MFFKELWTRVGIPIVTIIYNDRRLYYYCNYFNRLNFIVIKVFCTIYFDLVLVYTRTPWRVGWRNRVSMVYRDLFPVVLWNFPGGGFSGACKTRWLFVVPHSGLNKISNSGVRTGCKEKIIELTFSLHFFYQSRTFFPIFKAGDSTQFSRGGGGRPQNDSKGGTPLFIPEPNIFPFWNWYRSFSPLSCLSSPHCLTKF